MGPDRVMRRYTLIVLGCIAVIGIGMFAGTSLHLPRWIVPAVASLLIIPMYQRMLSRTIGSASPRQVMSRSSARASSKWLDGDTVFVISPTAPYDPSSDLLVCDGTFGRLGTISQEGHGWELRNADGDPLAVFVPGPPSRRLLVGSLRITDPHGAVLGSVSVRSAYFSPMPDLEIESEVGMRLRATAGRQGSWFDIVDTARERVSEVSATPRRQEDRRFFEFTGIVLVRLRRPQRFLCLASMAIALLMRRPGSPTLEEYAGGKGLPKQFRPRYRSFAQGLYRGILEESENGQAHMLGSGPYDPKRIPLSQDLGT